MIADFCTPIEIKERKHYLALHRHLTHLTEKKGQLNPGPAGYHNHFVETVYT